MAVADTLGLSPSILAAGLAVDNIAGLLYFPFVSWLGTRHNQIIAKVHPGALTADDSLAIASTEKIGSVGELETMMSALAIGLSIAAFAEASSRWSGVPSLPLSTLLAVLLATCFPATLQAFAAKAEMLGKLCLFLFFGSVGVSSGRVADVFGTPGVLSLLAFGLCMYGLHLAIILFVGKALNLSLPDILVASNANIGNAATASAFASSMGWRSRILPALLVGTFGNVIATFIGLGLGNYVFRIISR